jgi:hypothetical protein
VDDDAVAAVSAAVLVPLAHPALPRLGRASFNLGVRDLAYQSDWLRIAVAADSGYGVRCHRNYHCLT